MDKIIQLKKKKNAPVCCHKGADDHNIGYTKMVLADGTPIEAETYKYDDIVILSVIMPEFDTNHKMIHKVQIINPDSGAVSFSGESIGRDFAVLGTGMVIEGWEDNTDLVSEYVEYLADMGVIRWLTDLRDGAVEYLVDVEGNDLACVKVTMEVNGQKLCEVLPELHDFEWRTI